MGKIIRVEINELPKTQNQLNSMHWRSRHNHARKWHQLVHFAMAAHRTDEMPIKSCELILTRHSSRQCDFDGLVGSFKPIIDGLVKSGVLLDDRPEIIGHPLYKWEQVKRTEARISIEIRLKK